MNVRLRRRWLLIVIACALALYSHDIVGSAMSSCGAYSDRLCAGQSLMTSEYLESPDGDYKFYYQDNGVAHIFYVRTNPWTVVDTLHSGAWATPQELTYTDPWVNWTYGNLYGAVHISVWSTDGVDDYVDAIYSGTGLWPVGGHYLALDNDGNLKSIDDNGTMKVWAGPGA